MIDPINPPHVFTASEAELQEFLLFSAAVANKNAERTAKVLDNWLSDHSGCGWGFMAGQGPDWPMCVEDFTPFRKVYYYKHRYDNAIEPDLQKNMLAADLRRHSFGLHNQRATTFLQIETAFRNWSIKDSFFEQLISIHGIGPKTASFFLLYSGIDERHVVLDVHILRWLREQGWPNIPEQTPGSLNRYRDISDMFKAEAVARRLSVIELDRQIWQTASRSNND